MTKTTDLIQRAGDNNYIVHYPYDVGPRLAPSLKLSDGSRVTIFHFGRDSEGRVQYYWYVDDDKGNEVGRGHDFHSGVDAPVDVAKMFSVFAGFVDAWVESGADPESENGDLFPPSMWDWVDHNHDELFMVTSFDVDGNELEGLW